MADVTSGSVSLPLIISTSFIMGTGFMKCMPMTRSGRLVESAISFIEMLEVLDARIADSLQIESSSLKAENFSSGTSGIASITRSASAAASLDIEVDTKEIATSASSWVILCLETSFERDFSIV